MFLVAVASELVTAVLAASDPVPEDEDVKAGWMAFAIFLGLIVAVVLLGISLTRHLRTVRQARDDGVYGDAPPADDAGDQQPPVEQPPVDRPRPDDRR
ncbi:hypothetical protein [Nocardioides sp. SYSU D00038]|uniref:hypothetical protein n=1 Tax=Nocardioides sp. SYSU D00038 TaxID=2812554 RepID=UPI0019670F98|nr:hypothetical protein [Nocardioides sp. SYSU D00038]